MQESRASQDGYRKHYLDNVSSSQFDDITSLASILCQAPIVVLSFADTQRTWQKKDETYFVQDAKSQSCFEKTLQYCDAKTLIVPNLYFNSRFYDHPLVLGNKDISFYAAVPLRDSQGQVFGMLQILDRTSKSLSLEQIAGLELLAKLVTERVEREVSIQMERLAVEEAMEKQKEFQDAVLEHLNDGIVACNDKGELSVFNRATRKFHGLDSRADIPPEEWPQYFSLFMEDGKTLMTEDQIPLRIAYSGEIVRDYAMVVKSVDGGVRTLVCNGRAMFNKQGKKIGAVVAMQDVTAIRKADALIAATNKNLESLITNCPVAIGVFNTNFDFSVWNPGNEKLFGWTKQDALNRFANSPQGDQQKTEQINAMKEMFAEVLRTGSKVEKSLSLFRKDNKYVEVEMSMIPIYNDQNEIQEFMTVSKDISDIKQREANLLESNRALEAASVAKSQFLANMSHEIRTPLNGVIGMTDLVLLTELNDEQLQHLKIVQSSANNLLGIISDILDFSKIEAGKIDVESVSFDFENLIDEVHDSLKVTAAHKDIKLLKNVKGPRNAAFMGDPGRIRQVMLNLLTNAIKFSDFGNITTTLSVTELGAGKCSIKVEVSDRGLGISEEALTRLFKAFSQADISDTRKHGGTGLGLSISKGLVQAMKGRIGVESKLGEGSTFWFTLELDEFVSNVCELPIENRIVSGENSHSELRILLAEDNPINQKIALGMLKKLGYSADVVENGKAAVVALRKKSYDLVLMDCQMPEMDGYEATRMIRHTSGLPHEITIVAVTANAMKGDKEKCLEAGMTDYLAKPLHLAGLREVIERHFPSVTQAKVN